MRKVLGIAALLLTSGLAWAAYSKSETTSVSGGVATASAPSSTNTTLGISLGQATGGFRITVCAASGQTLSGSGQILIYLRNSQAGIWAENKGLAYTLASTARCEAIPDFDSSLIPINTDRAAALPDAVGVSGGSTVTIYYDACQKTGC